MGRGSGSGSTEQAELIDLAIEEPDIEDVVRRIYVGATRASPVDH
jgi:ABC-type uncharacterized transport system ATPase subunit